jgi:hypothetical protein
LIWRGKKERIENAVASLLPSYLLLSHSLPQRTAKQKAPKRTSSSFHKGRSTIVPKPKRTEPTVGREKRLTQTKIEQERKQISLKQLHSLLSYHSREWQIYAPCLSSFQETMWQLDRDAG